VVRQIGLLDEVFFLGFEDADWCLRARQAGFKALYVPAALIWHKDSYDTRKNLGKPGKDYYSIRNSVLFARKHMPARYWPLYCLSLSKYLSYRTAGYMVRIEFERIKALYRGLWSGYSTVMPRANSADRQGVEDPGTPRPRPDANR
jgi:GT2 family glycosyltransferase